MDEVKEWQNRPLEAVYPILSLDVKMVKISAQGIVLTKAVYLAVGVDLK